jgi:hypothetical protein
MKRFLVTGAVILALFTGCMYHNMPPHKFVKFDKVLVSDAAHPPKDGSASIGVGIITGSRTQQLSNGVYELWYVVEFADGEWHLYKQDDITLLQRFSFEDNTQLLQTNADHGRLEEVRD